MLTRVLSKCFSHALSTPEANLGLLKQFGIDNPNIYRNLRY